MYSELQNLMRIEKKFPMSRLNTTAWASYDEITCTDNFSTWPGSPYIIQGGFFGYICYITWMPKFDRPLYYVNLCYKQIITFINTKIRDSLKTMPSSNLSLKKDNCKLIKTFEAVSKCSCQMLLCSYMP